MAVHLKQEGDLDVLTLDHGKVHAIDDAFIEALTTALDAAERSPARAAVLTAAGKVFSAGLDLVWTAKRDRAGMERFVAGFEAMFEKVFFFPKPLVAAINGPAFAGGAILALSCDARVFRPGLAFALNEVLLGIPFPPSVLEISRHRLPRTVWQEALVGGETFSSERCAELGIGTVTDGDVVLAAAEVARRLSRGAPAAARAVKADLIAPVRAEIERHRHLRARFVEHWFSPEARALIEGRLAGLAKKS
jgi:enoyl-CoA hydratase